MFISGAKIVVIGSNSTCKSSPTIGSIGFIANSSNNVVRINSELSISEATIVFTRYGYERKARCEIKRVTLTHNRCINEELNKRKMVNRLIKYTAEAKFGKSVVVIGSDIVTNDMSSRIGKLLSYISPCSSIYNTINMCIDNDGSGYKCDDIRQVAGSECLNVLTILLRSKLNAKIDIIKKVTSTHNRTLYKRLLLFLETIRMLSTKHNDVYIDTGSIKSELIIPQVVFNSGVRSKLSKDDILKWEIMSLIIKQQRSPSRNDYNQRGKAIVPKPGEYYKAVRSVKPGKVLISTSRIHKEDIRRKYNNKLTKNMLKNYAESIDKYRAELINRGKYVESRFVE